MKEIHPLAAFVCFIAVTSIAACLRDPLITAVAFLSGVVFALLVGVRKFWLYFGVIIGVGCLNALFFHRGETVLLFLNNSPVTLESLLCGLNTGAAIAAVMLWFAAYNRIMDTEKHLYIFGRFTPRLGLMVSMALRFAPLFVKKLREISAAQRAMGMYSSEDWVDRFSSRLSVFGATVTWAFENGIMTAISMDARDYGRGRRTSYTLFRFRLGDGIFIGLTLALTAVLAFFSEELYFAFYPVITEIGGAPLPRCAYLALCLMPTIVEITEKIKWKYSALKISALPTAAQTFPL